MRPFWKDIIISAFLGMILSGILLNCSVMVKQRQQEALQETMVEETVPETVPLQIQGPEGLTALEHYLVGVVLAEMPASFEEEALKAQAVAARTYTWKAHSTGGKHGDGRLCADPSCCQAYVTESEYFARGGSRESLEKVTAAVESTSGYVLVYEGELIEATYFSCSGGSTEDAMAVWGTDYPYLQSVPSPGEEAAAHYRDTVTFTPEQFCEALGIRLEGTPENWFGMAVYTKGGGVASMNIGGQTYTGTELRSLLGLRSAAFTVSAGKEGIAITTKGYGHRVGMSQYGADAMAVGGSTFEEILAHYYPGTDLMRLS